MSIDTSREAVERDVLALGNLAHHLTRFDSASGDAALMLRVAATMRRLRHERDEARAEIAARERAARETALREAAAKCDARREVYENKLTDEAAFFAAAYETASGLILALIDEEPT